MVVCPVLAVSLVLAALPHPVAMMARRLRRSTKREPVERKGNRKFFVRKVIWLVTIG